MKIKTEAEIKEIVNRSLKATTRTDDLAAFYSIDHPSLCVLRINQPHAGYSEYAILNGVDEFFEFQDCCKKSAEAAKKWVDRNREALAWYHVGTGKFAGRLIASI